MHVAKLCPRASLYSYFQHPANLSTPACTHISNTRPTCQPQLGQLVCRSHPLLLSPRLGIFRSPRSLPRCVPHWEALRERGSTGGFPHVNSNDSRFFFSSGRVPALKEKGDGLREAQSGIFPTSRRAGPFPSSLGGPPATTTLLFTFRKFRLIRFRSSPFPFVIRSSDRSSARLLRASLFRFLFPLPHTLPPCARHFPIFLFSNFFLLYDCYQFPFSLLVFTHSKPYCDLPSSIYYLPYISLYFLLSPIPIESNIGLVFSSFFFLPLSFHTFKTML